jgi:hypothetical protein
VLCWLGFDDPRVDLLASHLLERQMADGGWNCRATPGYGGATHGSFHTTILALEGLLTGQVAKPEFTRFAFPPRWRYDALRGLDYFREAGAARDRRLQDAIALVAGRSRRGIQGRPSSRWKSPATPAARTRCELCES